MLSTFQKTQCCVEPHLAWDCQVGLPETAPSLQNPEGGLQGEGQYIFFPLPGVATLINLFLLSQIIQGLFLGFFSEGFKINNILREFLKNM